jgi:diguanylate cyclase (GGDEF)-like protein/PAS domain S-box-containing protein
MTHPDFPESLLAHAMATISEGSVITDAQQNILYCNAAFTAITGYTHAEMLGRNCRLLQGPGTDQETLGRLRRALAAEEVFRGHLLNYRKHGTPFWNDITITPLRDENGQITHYVSVQRDITTQVTLQNQLRFQAQHDKLTGLPNRFTLEQHLPKGLARTQHSGKVVAVGMIDLDDFKQVNDKFGHEAGDLLLQELARRLAVQLRESDLLARLGGDEFVVLIEGLDEQHTLAQLQTVLERLHRAVETPFSLGNGAEVSIGMSMGVALFPTDGVEGDTLLRRADAAMYQAKAHKHSRARWWRLSDSKPDKTENEPDLMSYEQAGAILALRSQAARQNLLASGLAMFMQPVVNLRTGEVNHMEALARLFLPDGTMLLPGIFLPLLAKAELNDLFRRGLDQALGWLVNWDTAGLQLGVSVNLPPSTLLAPDCAGWVQTALQQHGIAPHRLSLELLETENIELERGPQLAAIDQLIKIGVKLAMDDLGSGYSSLKRLSTLPFDVVKIDYDLLAQLRANPVQILSLIGSLIQIGLDFKQSVVVEGLEDAGMIEAASILGAPYGQGNGLAPPLPAAEMVAWVRQASIPVLPGRISTFLGALAYHWQFMHLNAGHPSDLAHCPMTEFFAAHGLQNSDGARWHIHLHGDGLNAQGAGQMLTDWLVTKVQSETPGG